MCNRGQGHSLLAQDNRDKRVELLQQYAGRFFPSTRYLDYAVTVEQYTLTKAPNLVLNVDGCIGALFLDLLHSCRMFTEVRPSSSGLGFFCFVWGPEAREQKRELTSLRVIANLAPHLQGCPGR